jgi:hypothetical protein
MHFKHPHLKPEEVENLQREMYRQDFVRLGPSLVRVARVWFEGYMNLRHSQNPLLRARARRMRTFCRSAVAGLFPAILFGPSREARRRARELLRDIRRESGMLTLAEKAAGAGAVALSGWTWLTMRMKLFQQPRLLRIEYNPEERESELGAADSESFPVVENAAS